MKLKEPGDDRTALVGAEKGLSVLWSAFTFSFPVDAGTLLQPRGDSAFQLPGDVWLRALRLLLAGQGSVSEELPLSVWHWPGDPSPPNPPWMPEGLFICGTPPACHFPHRITYTTPKHSLFISHTQKKKKNLFMW